MIDVVHEINAFSRQVGARTLDAGEARTITVTRSYPAELEDVWDAITSPERIPRWFLPVSGDLREGGRFALEGNASGAIERCEAPTAFAATWEYGGMTSWIEVTLTAEGADRTRLELVHIAQVDDAIWDQYGPGATGVGWDLGLLGLALYLDSGSSFDHDDAEAWAVSEEGREFATRSSERWGEASVAAGTDRAAADAAAARTTAFYTGAEAPAG
ncbi:MAG TPA: SRPBCC domain-containing protein [Capillimicrobium sp.]|jgi:uncharacterized protein YndB with AHSA1/START domain